MFDNLSDKLQRVFKNMRGEGKLSPANMEEALREIRVALLEAAGRRHLDGGGGRLLDRRV